MVSLKILWMIFNCCSVKPLLENFTFVSPPSTGLQVVIKWSDALFSIFDAELRFVMLGLSVLIVKIAGLAVVTDVPWVVKLLVLREVLCDMLILPLFD